MTRRRLDQANHVKQKRTFATSATSHHHENIATIDGKAEIFLDDMGAISHGQMIHADSGLLGARVTHSHHRSSRLQTKVTIESATTIKTMLVTTAEVAASPTAEAVRPH